jgi:tetratricopeptide (TPR) repeat protein
MSTPITTKISRLSLLTLLLLTGSIFAQPDLPANSWQEDLRFLQKTVHEDYSFLFKKTSPGAFDEEVEKLYAAIPSLESHEIIIGMARLVASFKYGHTSLRLGGEKSNFHQLPLNLYHFNDGVYIEGTHKDYQDALGAKVLEIEGVPIAEVLSAVEPVIPAENEQYAKGYGLGYLNFPEVLHAQGVTKTLKKDIAFTLEKDGEVFKKVFMASRGLSVPDHYGFLPQEGDWLSSRQQEATPPYLQELDKHYYFKYLPEDKAVYVRYSQVVPDPSEAIDVFYQRVFDFIEENEVDRLVLDVRLNGGGNNFNNKTVVTGIIRTEKINQVGKFFVITGRRTFSAAQNLINELDNYTNAIFVGEPSSENINFYGDNRTVTLPNSQLQAHLSWAWWQDKPQWQNGKWTAPHLAVDMSFAEYSSNQDPILDKALHFDSEDFILDPMDYLTGLFQAGKMEQLQSETIRMVADPAYRFFDFEGQMNRAGQRLLGQNKMQPAFFIFQFCTQLFPESAMSYNNLAQAFLQAGDKAKAGELSKQALQLDPEGLIGKNAQKRLDTMGKD